MTVPISNLTATWNNGATVFTGLKLNITNTASAAGSLLMDLQVGGTSGFKVTAKGDITVGALNNGGTYMSTIDTGGCDLNFVIQGTTNSVRMEANQGFSIKSDWGLNWNDNSGDATHFVRLYRDAANILAQRNATLAQTLRVYNTFTDASNYERGVFDWTTTANVLTIGTDKLGSGSIRNLKFIVGGVSQLDFGITNAGCFTFSQTMHAFGGFQCGNSTTIGWENGTFIFGGGTTGAVNNTFRLVGSGSTEALNFGGDTSSCPSIKRSGTIFQLRLANDSAYTDLQARSIIYNGVTVANLPGSPTAGAVAYVTDATATTIGSTVAGGGANKVLVWHNGTNWRIFAN